MKKIIALLARWSGVEKDIRQNERLNISGQIKNASYWFTAVRKYGNLYPFLYWMGCRIQHGFRPSGDAARELWDQMQVVDVPRPVSFRPLTGTIDLLGKPTGREAGRK